MVAEIPAIIILILCLAFLAFTLYLLLNGEHRRLLPVQLAASIILGHVPLGLFYHPASIHLYMRHLPVTVVYCWIMSYVGSMTQIIIPYTLMMFTIERLMYIKNPTGHAQKITQIGAMTLVIFPWVISSILAVIDVGVLSTDAHTSWTDSAGNHTYYLCIIQQLSSTVEEIHMIFRMVLGGMLPLLVNFVVTITVLIMWCCFKRKMSLGTDYSLMGEEIESTVRNSVIAIAVLNGLYIPIFIAESVVRNAIGMTYAILTIFGVIEGIMWICTLVEVRESFLATFKRCCHTRKPDTVSVQYKAGDAADVAVVDVAAVDVAAADAAASGVAKSEST